MSALCQKQTLQTAIIALSSKLGRVISVGPRLRSEIERCLIGRSKADAGKSDEYHHPGVVLFTKAFQQSSHYRIFYLEKLMLTITHLNRGGYRHACRFLRGRAERSPPRTDGGSAE